MIDNVPDERRCIVIGAGLLGLSAAWALTGRGWRVLVLEAARAPGHERSGSKGDARIFRLGYPEPHYVAMAVLARMLWHDLERASGRQLLHVTGQVTIGDGAALDAIAGALAAAGVPVERLSAEAVARRFPGIASAGPALVEPDSGVLAADECLRALREAGGFELRTGSRVTSVHDRSPDPVTVETAGGTALEADVVIACAGPATLGLVGTGAAVAAAPSLPQVAYFKARRSGGAPLPVFIEWGDDMIYGLPVPGGGPHAGTYKVSHHTPGPVLAGLRAGRPGRLRGGRRRAPRAPDRRRGTSAPLARSLARLPRSAASTTTPSTRTSFSTASAGSSWAAAPAGTRSSSARCWASSWPTWRRARNPRST